MQRLSTRIKQFPTLVILLCLTLGLALAHRGAIAQGLDGALPPAAAPSDRAIAQIGTVDPIPPEYQLGQSLYLESCATCHIAIPPAVLPDRTWQLVLESPGHYGMQISPPTDPGRLIIWAYLQHFSRPLRPEEPPPFRLENSRYFKALHPRVEFTESVRLQGCVTCHPQANVFDFRSLTSNWADAP
ncbi:MAG: hypothetical protein WBA10_12225 [Elainellaceae cyanobacterium]